MSGLNVKLQNGGTVNINTGEHIDNIKKKVVNLTVLYIDQ